MHETDEEPWAPPASDDEGHPEAVIVWVFGAMAVAVIVVCVVLTIAWWGD